MSEDDFAGMADGYDLYRLMDDCRYVREGGTHGVADDHHAIAYLLSCLLAGDVAGATKAIALYERQVPGFAYDRGARWDWARAREGEGDYGQ